MPQISQQQSAISEQPTTSRRPRDEPTSWLLVHSPLLGPGSWQAVAEELIARGDVVHVPDLRPALRDKPPYTARQTTLATAAVPSGPVVLAGHSGAGPLLPTVAAALAERGIHTRTALFVDAGLPHPGRSRRSTLPPELAAQLDAMSVDGVLPPWPQWWSPATIAELVPDPDVRARLADDCPPLPADLFDEPLPDTELDVPGGYVQLSPAYADAASAAEQLGWPVMRIDADHLWLLSRPAEVARLLTETAAAASPTTNAARLHVIGFNDAVRTGEWVDFTTHFADDAVMRFTNIPVGPFVGREAITRGYLEQPPDDTMTVRTVDELDDAARVAFDWDAGGSGSMIIRRRAGLVIDLTITFGD
jgi:hypothetical protein